MISIFPVGPRAQISSGFDQETHALYVAALNPHAKRRGQSLIGVGAALQEERHHLRRAVLRCRQKAHLWPDLGVFFEVGDDGNAVAVFEVGQRRIPDADSGLLVREFLRTQQCVSTRQIVQHHGYGFEKTQLLKK